MKEFFELLCHPLIFPVNQTYIAAFIAQMELSNLSPNTIKTYVSAISYFHKILELKDPTSSQIVKKCLMGLKKRSSKRRKKPVINIKSLKKLCGNSKKCFSNVNEYLLFQCIVTMLFFGLFRISELLGDAALEIQPLKYEDLQVRDKKILLSISSYKHSKGNDAQVELVVQKDKSICPVYKLKKLLEFNKTSEGYLFTLNGRPLTKPKFNQMLKKCCKFAGLENFTSHCFRIGGATLAAQLGRTDAEIRTLGRWKSNAVNVYIRKSRPIVLTSPISRRRGLQTEVEHFSSRRPCKKK